MPGGSPSMTTPTAGPCDSPNVVTRNSWPKVEDTTRWVRLLLLDDRDARRGLRVLARGELGDRALPELLVRRDHALELVQVGRPDVRARLFDLTATRGAGFEFSLAVNSAIVRFRNSWCAATMRSNWYR